MAQVRKFKLAERAAQGAWLTLVDKTEPKDPKTGQFPPIISPATGQPVRLKLLGMDSPQARRLGYHRTATFQSRVLARAAGGIKQEGITAEDIAESIIADRETLATVTVEWDGVVDADMNLAPCTYDNALDLYTGDPDIEEQASSFVADRKNFFDQSSKRSDVTPLINSASAESTTS